MTRPKPNSSSALHISCGLSESAIFTVPTLLDLASTVVTSIVPRLLLVLHRLDADPHHARRGVDQRVRVVAARLHGRRDHERLDARAGLEEVVGRAVAIARRGVLVAVIRVEGRLVDHRQHFAGGDVEHDDRARARLVRLHGGLQLAVGEVLHAQVDAGAQVLSGARRLDALDVLDRAAEAVAHHALRARLAAEPLVVGELEPFLADVVDVGEAEQVPGDFARRIVAPVLAQRVHAGDAERLDPGRVRRAHVAREEDELAVEVARDAAREPLRVAVERLGEPREVLRALARACAGWPRPCRPAC